VLTSGDVEQAVFLSSGYDWADALVWVPSPRLSEVAAFYKQKAKDLGQVDRGASRAMCSVLESLAHLIEDEIQRRLDEERRPRFIETADPFGARHG